MDPEELDKQIEKMKDDEQVWAAAAGVPPAPPVRRRTTMADLKKQIETLEHDLNAVLLRRDAWLDDRLKALETGSLSDRADGAADIGKRIDALEKGFLADAPPAWGEIDRRLTATETATGTLADAIRDRIEAMALYSVRMEEIEDMLMSSTLDTRDREESAEHQELEFAPPPTPTPTQPAQAGDIAMIANVCLTMNDVLMICRALKKSPTLSDMDKTAILNIACNSADVPPTYGMQVRAGVYDRKI